MMVHCYSPPLRGMEATFVVTIDQAFVVRVPTGTDAMIVGNAAIAESIFRKSPRWSSQAWALAKPNSSRSMSPEIPGAIADPPCRRQEWLAGARGEPPILRLRRQRLSIVKPGNDAEHNDAEYFKEVAKQ
jgi:hypothetical protein